jgi:hypothetical protein
MGTSPHRRSPAPAALVPPPMPGKEVGLPSLQACLCNCSMAALTTWDTVGPIYSVRMHGHFMCIFLTGMCSLRQPALSSGMHSALRVQLAQESAIRFFTCSILRYQLISLSTPHRPRQAADETDRPGEPHDGHHLRGDRGGYWGVRLRLPHPPDAFHDCTSPPGGASIMLDNPCRHPLAHPSAHPHVHAAGRRSLCVYCSVV